MKNNAAKKIIVHPSVLKAKAPCRPFIKWVGGKKQLLSELQRRIPSHIETYYEPFIGGGALLFSLQPEHAYISDVNGELINAYKVIRDDVEKLITSLKKHKYDKKYYYNIRDVDRTSSYKKWSPIRRASRLIYLNKCCFNGLYRVNSKGEFNTPFGRYTNPRILDAGNLRACSEVLRNVSINEGSFGDFESRITSNDFVYFDPPYVPLSETAYFTSYSKIGFDLRKQKELYDLCCRLDKRGVRFMLSNSSSPFIKKLYRKFRVESVDASRAINSKGERRGKISEVIVTNYDFEGEARGF